MSEKNAQSRVVSLGWPKYPVRPAWKADPFPMGLEGRCCDKLRSQYGLQGIFAEGNSLELTDGSDTSR